VHKWSCGSWVLAEQPSCPESAFRAEPPEDTRAAAQMPKQHIIMGGHRRPIASNDFLAITVDLDFVAVKVFVFVTRSDESRILRNEVDGLAVLHTAFQEVRK
jgi:hypothetical protein